MNKVFRRINGGLFKINSSVLEQMLSYKQVERGSLEAGGVLLGYYLLESEDIIANRISIPMPGDLRSKTRFFRNKNSHQKIINDIWNETDGRCNYLGEWHTHPENDPNPSSIDIKSWKNKLKTTHFQENYLFFIIIGIKIISVWEGNKLNLIIKKLEEIK